MNSADRNPKVLIICMTRRGGLLQFSDCLVKNLAQFCPIAVVTAKNAEHSEPDWDQNTISGFILDMGEGKEGTFQKLFHPGTWKTLSKAMNEFKPDIVHITAAQEWNPFIGFYIRYICRKPLVYTIHDVTYHEGIPIYFKITESLFRKIPNYLIVLTQKGKEQLIQKGTQADRILVVPHGVYDFFTLYSKAEIEPQPQILFFGRIEPYKGLEILLKATEKVLNAHPDWSLHIAGGGDLTPYQQYLSNPQIIVSNRFLSNEEVAMAMQRASIVALPYLSASQSGVIPTAFAFKKAVIATNVGGIPDMVKNMETGILIPPNNVPALEKALNLLIESPELRRRLGENGYRFAHEELGWGAIAKKHVAFYRNILDRKKKEK